MLSVWLEKKALVADTYVHEGHLTLADHHIPLGV
jgi:hypothetical protein